jgi:hypothetical protein
VLFCSLNKGFVTNVVPLEERRPIMMIITKSWGFVIVCLRVVSESGVEYSLALFTVNGQLVRDVKIPARIVAWSCFVSDKGFDYMAIALETGPCFVFEAFYLKLGAACFESRARVLAIAVAEKLNMGAVVNAEGVMTFFPCKFG